MSLFAGGFFSHPVKTLPLKLITTCRQSNSDMKKNQTGVHQQKIPGLSHSMKQPKSLHTCTYSFISRRVNHIIVVMVSVLASSAVDRGFESQSGQTNDYEIGICCFSAKRTVLRRKSKDWLGIRIICLSSVKCLSTNCSFSELQYMYMYMQYY